MKSGNAGELCVWLRLTITCEVGASIDLGDATSQFGHLRHRHDAQVKCRDGQPGVSVGKYQYGGCQVTFDGLDWVGKNADAGPANAKGRVDDGSGDAGEKRWHGRHAFLNQNTVV